MLGWRNTSRLSSAELLEEICRRVLPTIGGCSAGGVAIMSNKSLWSASQSVSMLLSRRVPKLSSCLSGLPDASISPSLPGCMLLVCETLLGLQNMLPHH